MAKVTSAKHDGDDGSTATEHLSIEFGTMAKTGMMTDDGERGGEGGEGNSVMVTVKSVAAIGSCSGDWWRGGGD